MCGNPGKVLVNISTFAIPKCLT